MQFLWMILIAAAVFAVCFGVDKAFQKLFRSKAEQLSGLAVRVHKRYGLFGVIMLMVGILALMNAKGDRVLLLGGLFVLLLGAALIVYYLSSGIFYDGDSFRVCAFGKKDRVYPFHAIVSQKLYRIQGGNIVVELHMEDGSAVSLQSTMEGVYPFLDTAILAWCRQKGLSLESCTFYDPAKSWWFPHDEEDA